MKSIIAPYHIETMLRSGYAVRTAQQYEFLDKEHKIIIAHAVSAYISSGNPGVIDAYTADPGRKQLAVDIANQIRYLRYPTNRAILAVYDELFAIPMGNDIDYIPDLNEFMTLFDEGHKLSEAQFNAMVQAKQGVGIDRSRRLWTLIVALRNGDVILPNAEELLK